MSSTAHVRPAHAAATAAPSSYGRMVLAGDVAALVCVLGLSGTGGLGLAFGTASIAALAASRSYRARIAPSASSDLPGIVGRMSAVLVAVAALGAGGASTPTLLRVAPLAILSVAGARLVSYGAIRELRTRGRAAEPVLIVGAGRIAGRAATTLLEHPEYGLRPVGFVDHVDDDTLPLPVLGEVADLDDIVRETGARRVLIAFGVAREAEIVDAVRACSCLDVDVHVMPRFFELRAPDGPGTADLWGIPVTELRTLHAARRGRTAKRAVDVVVAGAALLALSPLLAVLALSVRLSSPGPILFRQRRVGENGREVEVWKFRSMRVNTDSDTKWNVRSDPRVTRIGAILRSTSLDELPQLFNVLRGDMSLVGPRPERPHFVDEFSERYGSYAARHRVAPGLTGWAQVKGLRGDTSIEERVRYDNAYIDGWSLWRDLVIMASTIPSIVVQALRQGPEAGKIAAARSIRTRRIASARLVLAAGRTLVAVGLVLVVGSLGGAVAIADEAAPVTYTGHVHADTTVTPSADKPQSKLWYHDGSWWGLLLRADGAVAVHELMADHTWRDTATVVSTSPGSTGDAVLHGNRVVVASRTSSAMSAVDLDYAPATRSWSASAPSTIGSGGAESIAVARDSAGTHWVTFTQGSKVWVARTTGAGVWGAPFVLPVGASAVTSDDISAIVAFSGHVGVLWGNQLDDAFHFATHADGAADDAWSQETAWSGVGIAEDHVSAKVTPDGTVWAAVKTSRNDFGGSATDPLVALLVRAPGGGWTSHTVSTVADNQTRPVVAVDDTNQIVHVLATGPESGGSIYHKSAPMSTRVFGPGRGTRFVGLDGARINNATTTRQTVGPDGGLVVVATDHLTRTYYHGELALPTPDTTPPTAPSNVTATSVSSSEITVEWTASTDERGVADYVVRRDGEEVATVSTNSFADSGLAAETTYGYTVVARDAAGNVSAAGGPAEATTPPAGVAGIATRSASAAANAAEQTLTIPTPAGTATGDVLLASLDVRGSPAVGAPAGWDVVREDRHGNVIGKSTFVRVATSGEPASHTWTFSKPQSAAGVMVAYTGASAVEPVDASSGATADASYGITAPSVTTSEPAGRLVAFFGVAADSVLYTPQTMTHLAGAVSDAGRYDVASAASDEPLGAPGPTGDRAAASSRSAPSAGHLVALRASAGPDTTPPTPPSPVQAEATSPTSVVVSWGSSTDNRIVAGYTVLRDGAAVGDTTDLVWLDATASPSTTYAYTVVARDAAGNPSAPGGPAEATTPEAGAGPPGIEARGWTSAANEAGASLTIPTPTATRAGDVMLAAVAVRGSPVVTPPDGWTPLREDASGHVLKHAVYVRVAGPGEAASHTWTFHKGQSASGVLAAYAGVDTSAPVDASSGGAGDVSSSITAPSVAAGSAQATLVGFFAVATAATIDPPAEMAVGASASQDTARYTVSSAGADEVLGAPGSTGPRTASASRSAVTAGALVALRPAAS